MGDTVNQSVSSFSNFLGEYIQNPTLRKAIVALVVLVIGYFVAKFIASMLAKALGKVAITDSMAEKFNFGTGKKGSFEKGIGNITFWVLMLGVLIMVCDIVGLSHVIKPLNNLLDQFLLFIPKLVGAGIVLALAFIVSKAVKVILHGVFSTFNIEEKIGLNRVTGSSASLSNVIASIASTLVFLYILPQALHILELPSISQPISDLMAQIVGALPNIIMALVLITIGLYVGKMVQNILVDLLKVGGVDEMPKKLGIADFSDIKGKSISEILGWVVFASIAVVIFTQATSILKLDFVSEISSNLTSGFFRILGALVILFIGGILAKFAQKALASQPLVAKIAYVAVYIITGTMALHRANLAPEITSLSFQILIGAIGVALGIGGAIAIGLGGKDTVDKFLKSKVK